MIAADERYWLRPEHPPLPLAQAQALPQADGIAVHGHTLHALNGQPWPHAGAATEALRLNRLLLDFRLPEAIIYCPLCPRCCCFDADISLQPERTPWPLPNPPKPKPSTL